jgi:glycosyltransferase involved in cell wall biosynthesis
MDVAAGFVAISRGIPWVLSERSSAAAYGGRLKETVLRRPLARWADAVVANSDAGRTLWSGILRRGARAHVIRNTLSLEDIARARPEVASELGVRRGDGLIIFVGRLSEEKNIDLLLKISEAVSTVAETTVLICGDGPLRQRAEAFVRRSPVGDRIKLLGERRDVWQLMKASDVFISTSAFEGQPNAVLEAMACGCPIVVSDIPAHREFLDETSAAIVPLNKEAFVTAILNVIGNSEQTAGRIEEAKRRTAQFTTANAVAGYDAVYREAILRHKPCAE